MPRLLSRTPGSPVLWANFGSLSRWVARFRPLLSPPVLIISTARSGSNWVGTTLGLARDAAYLREPISKSYLAKHPGSVTELEVSPDRMPEGYALYAADAFEAVPVFTKGVVIRPWQWRLSDRSGRRLVIKEVNPLALPWLADTYRPRIIYLVRHPAGVASSFLRLGWINPRNWPRRAFQNRFSPESLARAAPDYEQFCHSPWIENGALQGTVMKLTLDYLSHYQDHQVVRYEDLCHDPVAVFRRLYEFAGLEWHKSVEAEVIAQSHVHEQDRFATYDTYRNSRAMPGAWKSELSDQALAELREGFLSRGLPYYRADEW
jgi:hypothetical protein